MDSLEHVSSIGKSSSQLPPYLNRLTSIGAGEHMVLFAHETDAWHKAEVKYMSYREALAPGDQGKIEKLKLELLEAIIAAFEERTFGTYPVNCFIKGLGTSGLLTPEEVEAFRPRIEEAQRVALGQACARAEVLSAISGRSGPRTHRSQH